MEERDEVVGELVVRETDLVLTIIHGILVKKMDHTLCESRANGNRVITLLAANVADQHDVDRAVSLREGGHSISGCI